MEFSHLEKDPSNENEANVKRCHSSMSAGSDGSFHSVTDDFESLDIKENNELEVSTDSDEQEIPFHEYESSTDEKKVFKETEKTSLLDQLTKEEESNEDVDNDEYYIDEVKLKDFELNLSDQEKINKKNESTSNKEHGNEFFKSGDYKEAALAYTTGLQLCPLSCSKERAILYANRAAARAQLEDKKAAIVDCSKAIELDEHYVKAILRRARLCEETESLDEALNDFKKVLEFDPSNIEARTALVGIHPIDTLLQSTCMDQSVVGVSRSQLRLPPLIEQRNEKLKEEMMGKLKDLGNLFLRPFGLSTNNFQLNQDQGSGGYNVQYKQNPT